MGHAKTEKLANGNFGVEITYGGLEAPFGGVDTSAPPAYIDGRCFVSSNNFIVVDNKLCVANWQNIQLPVLWNGVTGITPLKFGTFFNSISGHLNYALGFSASPITSPAGTLYLFYMTAWNFDSSGNPVLLGNDIFQLRLFDATIPAVAASLTLPILRGIAQTPTPIYTGTLALNVYAGSTLLTTVPVGIDTDSETSISTVATNFALGMNYQSTTTLITASVTSDGLSVVLTATTPGAAGNTLKVQDESTVVSGPGLPFYFPTLSGSLLFNLTGGADPITVTPPQEFSNVSVTAVGGTLYIGNIGPVILKYSGPGMFQISSTYAGVQVLRKFAGSLIGLGNIPSLGTVLKNGDMMFSWSAANDLDVWSPVDNNGNDTGAGFAQLADVEDALTGLIVSNNTAFILRSQGLSYATALGSGTDPFQFSHMGLGETGEGAQDPALVCQYDQTGVYVGNTNIFQLSGTLGAIGDKIKAFLFSFLEQMNELTGSTACAVTIGGDTFPVVVFAIGTNLFLYNASNKTWQVFNVNIAASTTEFFCSTFSFDYGAADYITYAPTLVTYTHRPLFPDVFSADTLIEGMPNTNSISSGTSIVFPQEELLFGRDVTIDGLYIALWADVTEDVVISFTISGVLFSTFTLTPTQFNTMSGNPIEIQIYPTTSTTSGAFTVHSPQLEISLPILSDASTILLRFSKIQIYASFDPSQRPV